MKKFITLFFCITMALCGCASNDATAKESSPQIKNEYTEGSFVIVNYDSDTNRKDYDTIEEIDLDVQDVKDISISRATINDPSMLSEFTNLESLDIDESSINDFSFLANLENLKKFSIGHSDINDFENISNLPNKDKISDFTIAYCTVNGNKLSDISLLKDFPSITDLTLSGNDISDLTPMSHLSNLEFLNLEDGNFNIASLKPLYDLEKLSSIILPLNCTFTEEDIAHFGKPGENGIAYFH